MFGNSKQLPITLALRGCRPAMIPIYGSFERQECLFEYATAFS